MYILIKLFYFFFINVKRDTWYVIRETWYPHNWKKKFFPNFIDIVLVHWPCLWLTRYVQGVPINIVIKKPLESRLWFLIFKAWQRRYKNVAERLPSFSFISIRNWVFPTKSDYLIRLNNEFCRSNNINLKFKKVYTIRLQKIYGLENFSLWARLNFIYVLKQVFFTLFCISKYGLSKQICQNYRCFDKKQQF